MRAIINRLRRLEHAAVPDARANAAVKAILEARRRRLGGDYHLTEYPPSWFDGCRGAADHILRARQFKMQQQSNEAENRR